MLHSLAFKKSPKFLGIPRRLSAERYQQILRDAADNSYFTDQKNPVPAWSWPEDDYPASYFPYIMKIVEDNNGDLPVFIRHGYAQWELEAASARLRNAIAQDFAGEVALPQDFSVEYSVQSEEPHLIRLRNSIAQDFQGLQEVALPQDPFVAYLVEDEQPPPLPPGASEQVKAEWKKLMALWRKRQAKKEMIRMAERIEQFTRTYSISPTGILASLRQRYGPGVNLEPLKQLFGGTSVTLQELYKIAQQILFSLGDNWSFAAFAAETKLLNAQNAITNAPKARSKAQSYNAANAAASKARSKLLKVKGKASRVNQQLKARLARRKTKTTAESVVQRMRRDPLILAAAAHQHLMPLYIKREKTKQQLAEMKEQLAAQLQSVSAAASRVAEAYNRKHPRAQISIARARKFLEQQATSSQTASGVGYVS